MLHVLAAWTPSESNFQELSSNYDFMDDNIDTRKRQSHQSLPQKGEKKPQQSACGAIFTLKGNYFISQDVT